MVVEEGGPLMGKLARGRLAGCGRFVVRGPVPPADLLNLSDERVVLYLKRDLVDATARAIKDTIRVESYLLWRQNGN